MSLAKHRFLLGKLAHVSKTALLSHDLQHSCKPVSLRALHHQLSLPLGVEEIVVSFRHHSRRHQPSVISRNVGVVVDSCPKTLLFKILWIERIAGGDVACQYAAPCEDMHAKFNSLNNIRGNPFSPGLGEEPG